MADETTPPTATASPDGARPKCGAGPGLLDRAIRCLTAPGADREVPADEPCYLRLPENIVTAMVALELLAMMRQWPGGAQRLEEMRARWLADPAACGASLQELIARPTPDSADTENQPWTGGGNYL